MNILISTNSKYFIPTIVMLESLFINNQDSIVIHLLYSNLTEDEINIIEEFIKNKSNGSLNILKVNKELFKNAPVTSRFTEEIYYRLLAQDILPNNIDRVLYLDVDMIVNKSLHEFYYQDFEDHYLVVCEGIGMSRKDFKTYELLEIPLEEKYFNSGVILYNLDLLRQSFNTNLFFEYIQRKGDYLTMPDQDVLNALFYDKVKYNDYKLYNYGIVHVKNKKDREFVRNNTVILHYIGKSKPWDYKYLMSLDDLFWKYAKSTRYKNNYYKFKILNIIYKTIGKPLLFLTKFGIKVRKIMKFNI